MRILDVKRLTSILKQDGKDAETDLAKWKDILRYGQRWIVETVFSCIKRMFVIEYVTAIRFENRIKEMVMKASLYNCYDY